MPDDKAKAGKQDRDRINLNEQYEVRDWCRRFNCTPEELRKAVSEVGVMAKDVEGQLGQMKAS